MFSKVEKVQHAFALTSLVNTLLAVILLLVLLVGVSGKPRNIRRLHAEIGTLQEELISAQITSQQLNYVKALFEKNLAFSSKDTLAQGASISFLKDLTNVLDKLKINLTSLEPEKIINKKTHIITPYRMEIVCNYYQFCQLLNKMEKSPRLISVSEFEIENKFEEYFNAKKDATDHCRISMVITTLTLLKSGRHE